jgi:hypothetical protein
LFYIHNQDDVLVPVAFTVKSYLTFTFKFHLPGEENTVAGKISADGDKVTATWTSISIAGVKGEGSVTAIRV